jgi:hypothetical protein
MLKYLVMFVAMLGGLVNLFLAWLLLPALAVGLWQTDWDPRRLSAEQKIFEMGHRLPVLWATRHPIDRGRYALAFYRFQSADDCLWTDSSGGRRLRFHRVRNERDMEVCLHLILSGAKPHHEKNPHSLNLMKILESDGFRCLYHDYSMYSRPQHRVGCTREFPAFIDVWRPLPTVSDWTGGYVLANTLLAWIPSVGGHQFSVSWRFEGEEKVPKRTSVRFGRFSK